jgi:hypothetical protein
MNQRSADWPAMATLGLPTGVDQIFTACIGHSCGHRN